MSTGPSGASSCEISGPKLPIVLGFSVAGATIFATLMRIVALSVAGGGWTACMEAKAANADTPIANLQSAIAIGLFPHHFHDDALATLAVEFRVEDLFPWPEVECAAGDRQHHLVSHERALQVRIGIVFARLMVLVRHARRRELLQPDLEVLDQTAFPVVDVDARGDVHRRDQD